MVRSKFFIIQLKPDSPDLKLFVYQICIVSSGINASITVENGAYTRVVGDWFGNALSAAAGTEVEIRESFSWTVNSLTANGFAFDPGTYNLTQLNTLSSSSIFTGTGALAGQITVVPEPSVALLGGLGLLGLLRRRR